MLSSSCEHAECRKEEKRGSASAPRRLSLSAMAYIWHVKQTEEMEGRGKVRLKNEGPRNTAPGRHLGQVRKRSESVVVVAL